MFLNDKLRITRMGDSSESPVWGRWLTMDVFNKQEPIVPRLRADILGQLNPFIQPGPGPYIMIFYSAGKLMMRLYLETFQHDKARDPDSLGLR